MNDFCKPWQNRCILPFEKIRHGQILFTDCLGLHTHFVVFHQCIPLHAQLFHSCQNTAYVISDYIVELNCYIFLLTLKVLITTTDAEWEGMGDAGSARYEAALLPPCPAIRVLSYSN